LPRFDQDLEAEHGMPENGQKLKQLFIDHDGLLIACPEYNSSITAVLNSAEASSTSRCGRRLMATRHGSTVSDLPSSIMIWGRPAYNESTIHATPTSGI
jgi:hypothetical protein